MSFSIPGVAADNSPDLSNSLVPSDISPQVPSDNSLQVPSDITGVSDSVLDDAISQSYENTMDYIRARSVGLLLSKRQDFSCMYGSIPQPLHPVPEPMIQSIPS